MEPHAKQELGELRLAAEGALVAIDEAGARLLGFQFASECHAASRDQVFAMEASTGDAVVPFVGRARLEANCLAAGGRRRCQLFASGDGRELIALFAPMAPASTSHERAEEAVRHSHELDREAERWMAEQQHLKDRLAQSAAEGQHATELLRESEARFRHLADALPHIVWTATPTGEVAYINSRGAEYVGVPAESGFRDGWLRYLHEEDRARVWREWVQSIRSGETLDTEYRLLRADGVYRWHLVRALPLRDGRGEVIRWFGTSTDIEERKVAQQTLQEEDRRKNDFLAMLSHELRNPLTPIRNATHVLRRLRPGAADFERAVAIVERQLALLVRLIDDLFDLSRITHGKIHLDRKRLDLVPLVRSLLADRGQAMRAEGLWVETVFPDRALWVEADGARVAQAITNLLENAQKFTPCGGTVRVEVRTESGQAVVSVEDTGVGLSPAAMEGIFVPFVQVASPAAGSRGGLGLGLSLVKSLAELHGGSVEAQSDGPGRGSTFTFRLPLAEVPSPAAVREAPPEALHLRSPRRILVVEDNPDAGDTLRLMLELEGHRVEVVRSGEEGVARARATHPDIVLSDVGLPGISGYDLARALRADPGLATHLVAITGFGQPKDREEALRSGFEHHLTKPFDPVLLHQLVEDLGIS